MIAEHRRAGARFLKWAATERNDHQENHAMRTRPSNARHTLLLASMFTGAVMLLPTASFADPDDHPTATHEKMENARDRLQDKREDIGEHKDMRMDRAQDRFQDRKENIHDKMTGAGEERRETLRNHLTNVKERYQDRKADIRDKAQDKRERAGDRFQDRKEDIKDKDRDHDGD
jgi:hypothetical protein